MNDYRLAVRLAFRELRTGLRGFRILLACLALGVATIAGVGSVSSGLKAGLKAEGRILLGGDVDLRLTHYPANERQMSWLTVNSRIVSEMVEMRSMARRPDGKSQHLVELKAVDSNYPIYGTVTLASGTLLEEVLVRRGEAWGAAVDERLLEHLGVRPGDRFMLGDAPLVVSAVIEREPDRGTRAFQLGPRVMISRDALNATGLVLPGSLVRYHYRVALPREQSLAAWRSALAKAFPDAGWRIQDVENAAPGIQRFVERVALFLSLIGLTALLVGGVGIANAVRAFIDSRRVTVATLKCLGASSGLIFRTYFLQVMVVALAGIAIGLVCCALAPIAVAPLLEGRLPVAARIGLYPGPLALAAIFGLLIAAGFTLWPLGQMRLIRPRALFRSAVEPLSGLPPPSCMVAIGVIAIAIFGLSVTTAANPKHAAWYLLGAALAFVLFRFAGMAVTAGLKRVPRPRRPLLRLALANLHRPGAPTGGTLLSLGLGLTVLVAVALLEHNLDRQIGNVLPGEAPGYYFIDIQPDQLDGFTGLVRDHPGVADLQTVPMLRGRIMRLGGRPVEDMAAPPDFAWILRGDRGLTWARRPPDAGSEIVAGEWWPPDYAGEPLVSFDAAAARAFGLKIGDTLSVNVLGREITATIANLRRIDWSSLGINFVMVFSPGMLEGAPQTYIATVRVSPTQELALEAAVTNAYPNVSAIRVKEVLEDVNRVLQSLGVAVRGIAAIAILAGILVLGGSIAADHRRRVYESVILKVLGAGRRRIFHVFLLESGFLGTIAALVAALIGSVTAWAVVTYIMKMSWSFAVAPVLWTLAVALLITLTLGFAGTWGALGRKAGPVLRND